MPERRRNTPKRAKKHRRVADSLTVSVLQATLESTADGILVVDLEGKIVSHNRHFEEMWRRPASFIPANNDVAGRRRLIQHVKDQLVNPELFVDGIEERYAEPASDSFDVLMFRDGRMLERYSIPLRLDGRSVGRVWSFRDVTARRRAECVQEAVYRISHTAHTAENLQQLLRAIHEIVGELMPAKNFYVSRSEEHTSELQSPYDLVCRLLLEKKKHYKQKVHLRISFNGIAGPLLTATPSRPIFHDHVPARASGSSAHGPTPPAGLRAHLADGV